MSISDATTRLADALIHHYDDSAEAAFQDFERELPTADDPADLAAAIEVVATRLATAGLGVGDQLAVVGAMLVGQGAPAAPLVRVVEPQVITGLVWAAAFPGSWDLGSYGSPLPDPTDVDLLDDVLDQMKRNLNRAQIPAEEADALAVAWFSVTPWLETLVVAAQPTDGRVALSARDELMEALATINEDYADQFPLAYWLDGILRVLEDEPLVVIHRSSGRGYRLTIGGIGDNFQLHTLLADRLIGNAGDGLIYDVAPDPAWVAAASTGDIEVAGGIKAQFELADAYGDLLSYEERPTDIPKLDGVRVVVLDRLQHPQTWNAGRLYAQMPPTVRLDAVMSAEDSARWMERIQPVSTVV